MAKQTPRPFSQQGPGASIWRNIVHLIRRQDPHKDLGSLLELADPDASLEDRIVWLSRLVTWLRGPVVQASHSETGEAQAPSSIVRVRFFLQVLQRHPEWSQAVSGLLKSILLETDATSLMTQTELSEQSGFFSELGRRLTSGFLPPPPRPKELRYVVEMVFTNDLDPKWISEIPKEDWDALTALIAGGPDAGLESFTRLEDSMVDAILQLAVQVSALGLSPDVRERMEAKSNVDSAFLAMARTAFSITDEAGRLELLDRVELCRFSLRQVQESFENQGVSLALLYRVETLLSLLRRLETLLHALAPGATDVERRSSARLLVLNLLSAHRMRVSASALLRMNFDLFAKKLVEHAGETGEHYITRNKSEYVQMFKSGAGGGVLTVATTLFKFLITALHAPLAIEGFLVWVNYSGSFLAMQFLGFTLATKQPSMTAAALASKMRPIMTPAESDEFVEEVVRTTRSQFIAAVGNVAFVIIGALIVSLAYKAIVGTPILNGTYSEKVFHDFNPFTGFTLFYAALTGVLLWLSSLAAGWLQNWVNIRALPDAIRRQRRFHDLFGQRRAEKWADWIHHNASAIGGNVSIGFLLAFVPILGKFFGLPIDIRHITLSSGALTFALTSIDPAALVWTLWIPAALGLIGIGILNFGVSFFLALVVATRSRRLPISWLRPVMIATLKRFKSRPLDFFVAR